MTGILMFLAAFVVLRRVGWLNGARRRRGLGFHGPWGRGPWGHGPWQMGPSQRSWEYRFGPVQAGMRIRELQVREPVQASQESAYETLKRRFVAGELNAEQYEAELDLLLKTPEGRALISP